MCKLPAVILVVVVSLSGCGSSEDAPSTNFDSNSNPSTDDIQTAFVNPVEEIAGKTIVLDIDWGVSPWASSGQALVEFETDSYIVRGDQSSVINSAGTYSYTEGVISVSDSAIGVANYTLQFTDSTSGLFVTRTEDGVTRQLGAFTRSD